MTYIRSCIDESSGTSDVVSKAGLVKRRHMVYGQNVHIVTLENQSSSQRHLVVLMSINLG